MKLMTKTAIYDGLSERDTVALYGSAQLRQVKSGELLSTDPERTESYLVVMDGQLEVQGTVAVLLNPGDCFGPQRYPVRATAQTKVLEVRSAILDRLPEKVQAWVHRSSARTNQCFIDLISAQAVELETKSSLLSSYAKNRVALGREVVASPSIQNFIQSIPKLPAFTTEIATKLQSDKTSVQEIVDSIKRDPAMAGTVLRCVNSAEFGFSRKIETFYHATIILGFNRIYELLLRDGIKTAIAPGPESEKIHVHSWLISTLCFEIANISEKVQPQTATTIGLLHDLGKSVRSLLMKRQPAVADAATLLDTAALGGSLARHWGLPERICSAIEAQNEPEFTPPSGIDETYRTDIAVLYIAHIFEGLILGKPVEQASQSYVREYFDLLRISPNDANEVCRTRILPALEKNKERLPLEIQTALTGDLVK